MTEKRTRAPEFVVDLGGVDLPDEIRLAISKDIQRAVLMRLPDLDLRGDIGIRFPFDIETMGIIIREGLEGIFPGR